MENETASAATDTFFSEESDTDMLKFVDTGEFFTPEYQQKQNGKNTLLRFME